MASHTTRASSFRAYSETGHLREPPRKKSKIHPCDPIRAGSSLSQSGGEPPGTVEYTVRSMFPAASPSPSGVQRAPEAVDPRALLYAVVTDSVTLLTHFASAHTVPIDTPLCKGDMDAHIRPRPPETFVPIDHGRTEKQDSTQSLPSDTTSASAMCWNPSRSPASFTVGVADCETVHSDDTDTLGMDAEEPKRLYLDSRLIPSAFYSRRLQPPTSSGWTPLNVATVFGSLWALNKLVALGARPLPSLRALLCGFVSLYGGFGVVAVGDGGPVRRPVPVLVIVRTLLALFSPALPMVPRRQPLDAGQHPLTALRVSVLSRLDLLACLADETSDQVATQPHTDFVGVPEARKLWNAIRVSMTDRLPATPKQVMHQIPHLRSAANDLIDRVRAVYDWEQLAREIKPHYSPRAADSLLPQQLPDWQTRQGGAWSEEAATMDQLRSAVGAEHGTVTGLLGAVLGGAALARLVYIYKS